MTTKTKQPDVEHDGPGVTALKLCLAEKRSRLMGGLAGDEYKALNDAFHRAFRVIQSDRAAIERYHATGMDVCDTFRVPMTGRRLAEEDLAARGRITVEEFDRKIYWKFN